MNRIKLRKNINLYIIFIIIFTIPTIIMADEKQSGNKSKSSQEKHEFREQQQKQQPAQPPAKVVTAQIVEEMVSENTEILGTLFFDSTSSISTEVNGLVSSANFKTGDFIKKNSPMIQLETDFITNEISSVQASILQIEGRIKKAQKDLNRYSTLYKQEAASEKEFDDMSFNKDDLVKQKAVLQTNLELAKLKKSKSIISAPFDGVVLEKNSESGSWVAPGAVLCNFASVDELFVKVPLSESLLKYSPKGQKVDVVITALDKSLKGTVDGIIPLADPQTRTVFIKVKLPRVDGAVLNMSAKVSIPVGEKKKMFLAPRDALINFNGQNMIYTINDDKAVPLPVKVISYIGNSAAVEGSGIKSNMAVVVDGNDRLRPQQPVIVIGSKE